MPTIVVADDETDLRDAVVEYLGEHGLRVLGAASAEEVRAITGREPVHVVVLDIAMPGEDGLSLARWLRAQRAKLGILFATAADAPRDRIVALQSGGDDYIVKPYDLREMLARVRSILRRLPAELEPVAERPSPVAAKALRVGTLDLDVHSHRLSRNGEPVVELTALEAGLLAALATRPNRVLSREQLLALGGAGGDPDAVRSIDVRIARLRRKIESPESPSLIRTVRGEGYMFVPHGETGR